MTRSLLLLAALTIAVLPARAQVCPGPITLSSQLDLYFAYTHCLEVTSFLTISGADIVDLSPLDELTLVGGTLRIDYNDALPSLAGLEALASVGGLVIVDNDALPSLSGLESLASAGFLWIEENLALASLNGLDALTAVGADLSINRNDALTSLAGLEALTAVGGNLSISSNNALSDCACGLAGLIGYDAAPDPAFPGVAGTVQIGTSGANAPGCNSAAEVLASVPDLDPTASALDGPGGTPVAQPVAVPAAGATVHYTATLTNDTGGPLATEVWPALRFPDGTLVVKRRAQALALGVGASRTFTGAITLPDAFPAGTYTFYGVAGTHPGCGFEQLAITMEKAAARTGAPALSAEAIRALDFDDLVTFVGEDEADTVALAPAPDGSPAEAPAATADGALLGRAYPNPFNPTATVPFSLTHDGNIRLAVYDLLGREVAVLAEGRFEAGAHTAVFEAAHLATGTYLVRFTSGARVQTQRLLLVK